MIEQRSTSYKGPSGWRAYAVGDVHGRLDLLDDLLARIEQDRAQNPAERTVLVFLGDLIDRGPDSRGVVERLRTLEPRGARLICLMGNHEEVLTRILNGERGLVQDWLAFGGAECLRSYGADPRAIGQMPERDGIAAIQKAIPVAHAQFIASFSDTLRFGDYLFVHAGIRPGIAVEKQRQVDLRWIRADFLDHDGELGLRVVHGHTISHRVSEQPHRIGIDTGAWHSGRLTAIVIEGDTYRFISTLD